jgi:hypothetical protein
VLSLSTLLGLEPAFSAFFRSRLPLSSAVPLLRGAAPVSGATDRDGACPIPIAASRLAL